MNPARGTCGPTCTNQARVTARCSTSRRSMGVASYTRMTLRGSTRGSTPRTRYCAGSAVWCVVAIVRPQQAAGNVPANADGPLPVPLPPHPHPLLLLLPPKILPSSPELRATPERGKVPFLPPKLIKTRIRPPPLFPFSPYDEPLHEFKTAIHIQHFRISEPATSSSPPFPYRWRLDATLSSRGDDVVAGVSAVARRSGSLSRGGDLCGGQRAPFPSSSLSRSPFVCCVLLCFLSSAPDFSFQHYSNKAQKKKHKIGLFPRSKNIQEK